MGLSLADSSYFRVHLEFLNSPAICWWFVQAAPSVHCFVFCMSRAATSAVLACAFALHKVAHSPIRSEDQFPHVACHERWSSLYWHWPQARTHVRLAVATHVPANIYVFVFYRYQGCVMACSHTYLLWNICAAFMEQVWYFLIACWCVFHWGHRFVYI